LVANLLSAATFRLPNEGLAGPPIIVSVSASIPMAVPEGWTAELSDERMAAEQLKAMKALGMKPGDVYELTK